MHKKESLNYIGWHIIIYTLILNVSTIGFTILLSGGLTEFKENKEEVAKGIIWYAHIIGVTLGILFMLTRKQYNKKEIFKRRQKMSLRDFIITIPIMFSAQLPSALNTCGVSEILKAFNLQQVDMSKFTNQVGFPIILYGVILGPLAEEIMFRGLVMFKLEENGKRYAYIISSILFGIMHGDLTQIPFAILGGLILGYIAQKYGLIYSYIFHMINNGTAISYNLLNTRISESILDKIYYLFFIITFLIAVIIGIKNRHKILNYLSEDETEIQKFNYKQVLLNVPMVIFYIYVVFSTVSGIEVIPEVID